MLEPSSLPSSSSTAAPPTGFVLPSAEDIDVMDEPPAKGSWVAELEEAKENLVKALRAQGSPEDTVPTTTEDGTTAAVAVLQAYLRLCRAYSTLRRWDRVLVVSKRGLRIATALRTGSSPFPDGDGEPTAASTAATALSIRKFRELAKAELSVPSLLDQHEKDRIRHLVLVLGDRPGGLPCLGEARYTTNVSMLQGAVMWGDVRLFEELVALGAPIDVPTEEPEEPDENVDLSQLRNVPPGLTALLMACALLAMAESTQLIWVRFRTSVMPPIDANCVDMAAECAMQLVHLGADPHAVMPRIDGPACGLWLWKEFEGKSAFQIAAMTKRRSLVALMLEHMQLGPEARAEVVHCRCGSRLPWKLCHSNGPGQPPHYVLNPETQQVCYRVSPLGRCPCKVTTKTYYKCCWRDNRYPVYLNDRTGALYGGSPDGNSPLPSFTECLHNLAARDWSVESTLRNFRRQNEWIRYCGRFLRKHPSLFAALCDDVGPKSRMAGWDLRVYAECVERLERLERPFLWRDVHWDLDRSLLLWRCEMWNAALDKYCTDAGLMEGAERDRVVSTHAANPCGPCGRVGCSAFEGKVRQFRRCASCKAVSYCSRKCQKKDWPEHQKACRECLVTSFVGSSHTTYHEWNEWRREGEWTSPP